MDQIKTAAADLATFTAVKGSIDTEPLRREVRDLLAKLRQSTGSKQVVAELPDGTEVATITYLPAEDSAYPDEAKFLAWCKANRPDEVVEIVRPSFVKAMKSQLAVQNDKVVNSKTGEVVEWARIRPASEPNIRLVFKSTKDFDGREAIAAAWRNGRLGVPSVVAPPALAEPKGDAAATPDRPLGEDTTPDAPTPQQPLHGAEVDEREVAAGKAALERAHGGWLDGLSEPPEVPHGHIGAGFEPPPPADADDWTSEWATPATAETGPPRDVW